MIASVGFKTLRHISRRRVMMAATKHIACLSLVLAVAGCAQSGTLYPANPQASRIGPLSLEYTAYGTGAGPVRISMPSGELLTGQYRVVENSTFDYGSSSTVASGNAVSYGSATAYGPGGVVTATGTGTTYGTARATTTSINQVTPGSRSGMCSMVGDRGTTGTCEFFVNRLTGVGGGSCQLSNGAQYNLMF